MSVLRAVHEAATDPIVWPASAVFGFASLAISSALAALLSVPIRWIQRRSGGSER